MIKLNQCRRRKRKVFHKQFSKLKNIFSTASLVKSFSFRFINIFPISWEMKNLMIEKKEEKLQSRQCRKDKSDEK